MIRKAICAMILVSSIACIQLTGEEGREAIILGLQQRTETVTHPIIIGKSGVALVAEDREYCDIRVTVGSGKVIKWTQEYECPGFSLGEVVLIVRNWKQGSDKKRTYENWRLVKKIEGNQ